MSLFENKPIEQVQNPYATNPTFHEGAWRWWDECGELRRGYRTERAARRALDAYCYWLDHGPTRWQSFWWPIRNFFWRYKC